MNTAPWITTGARATDTTSHRTGVIQLLQDELGSLRTEADCQPTRALLRPLGPGVPWWAPVADLTRGTGGEQ